MTAKRKDDGELEVVNIGGRTVTYRTALLLLVALATPAGDRIWTAIGISTPTSPAQIAHIESRLADTEKKVESVGKKVDAISSDLTLVSTRLTGFLVDFDRYKKEGTR